MKISDAPFEYLVMHKNDLRQYFREDAEATFSDADAAAQYVHKHYPRSLVVVPFKSWHRSVSTRFPGKDHRYGAIEAVDRVWPTLPHPALEK